MKASKASRATTSTVSCPSASPASSRSWMWPANTIVRWFIGPMPVRRR
jgi:hypothetical protein